MLVKRINNTIVSIKDNVVLHIYNGYPLNYIDDEVDSINNLGLNFLEIGVCFGDPVIVHNGCYAQNL